MRNDVEMYAYVDGWSWVAENGKCYAYVERSFINHKHMNTSSPPRNVT